MMNLITMKGLLLWTAFIGLLACNTDRHKSDVAPIVARNDSCLSHPSHHYEIYIPPKPKQDDVLPLLVVIDPHADGKLAVHQFQEAADRYAAIVVGSMLIQNNDPTYMKELDEMISDVQHRYQVAHPIYLAGFSGGARMALNYASTHAVAGVIACGAFAGQEQLSSIKCTVLSITGMDDFNFSETAQYILKPGQTPPNVCIELTNASHNWPDEKLLASAFAYFRLTGSHVNSRLVKNYVNQQLARVDSLVRSNEWLSATMISRNMGLDPGLERIGKFKSKTSTLMKDAAYVLQRDELLKGLQFEMRMRQVYLAAMSSKDEEWWKKEIGSLNHKINSESNVIKRAVYLRIKGFLGIVCYSYCNRFVVQKNVSALEQTLMIYRLTEPDNEDMKHFATVLSEMK